MSSFPVIFGSGGVRIAGRVHRKISGITDRRPVRLAQRRAAGDGRGRIGS